MITNFGALKKKKWRKAMLYIPASRGCDFCKFRAKHAVHCMDDDNVYYQCHHHFDVMEREAAK